MSEILLLNKSPGGPGLRRFMTIDVAYAFS